MIENKKPSRLQLLYKPHNKRIITITSDGDKVAWGVNHIQDKEEESKFKELYKSLLETIFYLIYHKTEMTRDEIFEFVGVELVSDTFGGEPLNDKIYKWNEFQS